MKLRDIRETYYRSSAKVSDISRQLAFAGIAVVWILKDDTPDKNLNSWMYWILGLMALTLALDLAQYVVKTTVWGKFNDQQHEAGVGLDDDVPTPARLNTASKCLFRAKTTTAMIGHAVLIIYLATGH